MMIHRPRRLRSSAPLREAVAETRLHPSQLIQPYFVMEGRGADLPIESMPGIARQSVEQLVQQVGRDLDIGLTNVLLFGVTEHKDEMASSATAADGLVSRSVAALREAYGEALVIMTDVCLCGSMSSGHCGVLRDGKIVNDESLPLLSAMALAHAQAGADVVAPSDMMDGRVAAMRQTLDDSGLCDTAIMSYSTKFASSFYGPFRDAANSSPQAGDRKTYQLDYRNGKAALRESLLDEDEGADMLMVKPALAYLDVLTRIAEQSSVPVAAYNVSGEYSMVKAAAAQGWVDEPAMVNEVLHSMARAGADLIITYHGRDALGKGWLS
ncbi:MAG: porphobilinogen synthase [Pseudohongiellaceae bacterium]|jgi:porphobilinogen synthase